MARPRTFDEKAVLDAAVDRFWTQGYEATSTRELAQSMHMTLASMHNAFGDKRTLFRRALDHYLDGSLRRRIARHEAAPSAGVAIAGFLRESVERSLGDGRQRGCLLVNSALEVTPADPDMQAFLDAELMTIESFFRRCIARGRQSGEIPDGPAPEDAARLLFASLLGIRVLARVRPDRDLLEGAARAALACLGLPALPAPHSPDAAASTGSAANGNTAS
ncbi:TetR/AcrR family transcriptional regulator [Azospirillum picis]|uniref:TetR/AcrR family transcriptional repressor of nem operon n=1 Tax=Azospirillum picis TaxID=488438 RepID=A0ABU0MP95_9PROT|nr:TetR/AcrR family transcriptional regulator [Azospirillum picis]MBP2301849.1 TetR/AcrR family transcriptional repressor of nem operon [Azospirillum picis]MDQ0534976.1 TetR/AcrR family transcriptional repressor of nem operon [Azospirillum picis]